MGFFNRYSLLYFAVGLFVFFFRVKWIVWLILIIIFELLRNLIFNKTITNTDVIMSVGNIIFFTIGWCLGYYFNELGTKYQW